MYITILCANTRYLLRYSRLLGLISLNYLGVKQYKPSRLNPLSDYTPIIIWPSIIADVYCSCYLMLCNRVNIWYN